MSEQGGNGWGPYLGGIRAVLPFLLESLAAGVAFGILARTLGMGVTAPIVMSATTFAGSAQFAALSATAAGAGTVSAAAAAALVNARYVAMGIAVGWGFRGSLLRRIAEAQLLVDESWAVASADGRFEVARLVGAGAALWISWVSGTAVGLVGALLLPPPEQLGLDAAFPSLLVALLAPHVRQWPSLRVALLAAAIAAMVMVLLPPGVAILVASLACLVGLRQ